MLAFPAIFRDATEADRGFVIGHWLESLRADRNSRRRGRGRDEKPHVVACLATGITVVAADPADPSFLFGFACGSDSALHYVFARQTRRRGGLATSLLHELLARGVIPHRHTYSTRDGRLWWAESSKGSANGQAA